MEMDPESHELPHEETPEEFTGIKIRKRKTKAAGLSAIYSGLKHVRKYMTPSQVKKTMFAVNQKGGFDCPGCAWPDPDDDRSKLGEYCENGMKAIAEEAQKKLITPSFFTAHSILNLSKKSDFELGKLGRLEHPMVLNEAGTHYMPISWEDAFRLIGDELSRLDSPDDAIFYTSGRTSNEAAFLYQLFVRVYGTNNLPDCSNMCHESSGKGLSETLGIGKGSVTLDDIHQAEAIIVMGQNPGTNHPRMLTALEKCKDNGGKIISVNPLPEAGLLHFINPQKGSKLIGGGTRLADLFLQVRINGDIALLKAIMILLFEEEALHPGKVIDQAFIEKNTLDFEAFKADLLQQDLATCINESGVSEKDIHRAVDLIKYKKKVIICWAMGLTQHINGVENIREIVNLLLMKGAIGKPGAGTCPVRGHSNVQGDRTMGIWEAPKDSFLDNLDKEFNIISPRHHGFSVVDAIKAMHENKAKVFIGLGGNFISATPDTKFTAVALRNCNLTVHISTKLNRSHLVHGKKALILPCLGRTEIDHQASGDQIVSVENSMGIVHQSKGVLAPASTHLKSEVSIVCEMAKASLQNKSSIPWDRFKDNYDAIRERIEKVIPGFEDFNTQVRKPGGFYLPNGAREGKFSTKSGRAHFTINPSPKHTLKKDEYIMMTVRSHDQYNTTIYGLNDRYRGIYNERRIILMNHDDMIKDGFDNGDVVHLFGHHNGVDRVANNFIVVKYDIPSKCVATYFPEANVLVPIDSFAKGSKTPASKFVKIKIQKSEIS